jgi:hypothetical protein
LSVKNHIDYGGGDGFVCRLMRDIGVNSYLFDKYSLPTYVPKHTVDDITKVDMLSAFEVIEHMDEPAIFFAKISSLKFRVVVGSTCFYNNQGENWDYIQAKSGQHIFFPTLKAVKTFAKNNQYKLSAAGNYFVLISAEESFIKVYLIKLLIKTRLWRLLGLVRFVLPMKGTGHDMQIYG